MIRGFKYVLDTNKLDIYRFRLFLKMHNISKERENDIIKFVLLTNEIVQMHKTVGDWDMEVDIESQSKAAIKQLIIQLREQFKDIIEDFNMIEFYQYYKRAYLPRYIFEEER